MKKLLLIASLVLGTYFASSAQTIKKDSTGNYISVKKSVKSEAKNTGKTFTDSKGNVYPVFESVNGKLFYTRTSKAGNEYNVYLKLEG